jgi:type III pantothenate kinase
VKPNNQQHNPDNYWLALMIGNSRLHFALFLGETLQTTWDTEYLSPSLIQQLAIANTPPDFPKLPISPIPIILASVVPTQTALWQTYPKIQTLTLEQIPLAGMYSTLGIDRALALWGAGITYGFPVLVIDAGTALTFTGADANKNLIGGAILPGLGLQLASLGQKTGQLPLLNPREIIELPPHFALNTSEAIQSGIIYTLLAGIKDFIDNWLLLFPESKIAITGGDGELLTTYLKAKYLEIASQLIVGSNLIFCGIKSIVI